MREIKFRAWDGFKFGYVHFGARQIIWPAPDYFDQTFSGRYEGTPEQVRFTKVDAFQQFTGLKDKNGKEIYEGDLIEYRSHPAKMQICKVVWDETSARFMAYRLDEGQDGRDKQWWSFFSASHLKVIGNIYENPELIRQNTNAQS
jgi:hypothetical protein